MKDELIDKIILALAADIDLTVNELKSRLYMALKDYNVGPENTEIVVRGVNRNEMLFKKFIVTKKIQGLTEQTIFRYSVEIPKVLEKIGKPAEEITSDDILYYLAVRECRDKVSKTTCKNELRCLSTFLGYLFLEGIIPTNPVLKIGTIKLEKKQMKAFTDVDIAKIKQSCKNLKETAVVEMLLSTGCRATELVNIKQSEIQGNKVVVNGKGNKERIVYLNATAMLAVDKYMKSLPDTINQYLFPKMKSVSKLVKQGIHQKEMYLDPRNIDGDEHMSRDALRQYCAKIGKRAGVEDVHPHRFRRTCATMALKRGMPIEQVSKMLGHEKISTTQIYLDLNERDLELAHEKYVV